MENSAASTSLTKPPSESISPNDEKKNSKITIREFDNWSKNDHMIFRVPKILRGLNDEKAYYTPQLVSIGPFHHGEKSFEGMQYHKKNYYLNKFLQRTSKSEDELVKFIQNNFQDMIQSKYAGAMEIDENEFVDIILIDSCFIFELFCFSYERYIFCSTGRSCSRCEFCSMYEDMLDKDYIMRTPLFFQTIRLDLLKFENQIPFSFLEKLYEKCKPIKFASPKSQESQVNHPKKECCVDMKPSNSTSPQPTFLTLSNTFFHLRSSENPRHFIDLYRRSWLRKDVSKRIEENTDIVSHLHHATKLDQAGIEFAPLQSNEDSGVKVDLSKKEWYSNLLPFLRSCKLQLPEFIIDDQTESIFRNVIAMEQCQPDPKQNTPFCNYVSLMNKLVDTVEDVDLLIEKKIITNHLGSHKDVANMINKISQNMTLAKFIYSDEYKALNDFYDVWYNHAKATLKRIYFKDVWTTSSTFVAIMIVIFTIISSINSICSLAERFSTTSSSLHLAQYPTA